MNRFLRAFAPLIAGLACFAALLPTTSARADFAFTLGSGATAFSFTASTGGSALCAAANTHCFGSVPVDTAGAQLFATGNAGFVRAASGSFASGSFASGSHASGSFASGAFASGSVASGAMVDLGAIADAAATVGSTGTLSAKLRLMTSQLDSINTNVQAGASGTGSAVPASAIYMGVNVGGNLTGMTPGVAGTASTQVWTIQGAASMTKLLVTPDANSPSNVAQINGVTPLMGNGVTGTGSPRVTISSDNTPFLVNAAQGSAALSATNGGFQNVLQGNAVLSATNGLFNNLLQGNAVLSATNGLFANVLQGNAVLSVSNPSFSRSVAGATGGGTLTSAIAPATPAGVNLKASAGGVFRVFATTVQSTPVYIKFYNASSAPTCGSGTPVGRFMVPAAATAANGAGTNIDIGDMGAAFGTGIGYCVTGALADNDTTAITANNTLVNIVWN